MATKKPRKREYNPPSHEVVNKKETGPRVQRSAPPKGRAGGAGAGARAGQVRLPPEPSIKRTMKRLPVYFVILLALQYFLIDEEAAKDYSQLERVAISALYALLVTVAFAPFMYWMERWSYRMQMKRINPGGDGGGARAGKG
jgi:hypothetical protein